MASKSKKDMDPEELLRRKFRAKCQFRGLVRLVMANTYWLIEDIDHYEGVDDVQRRVQQAVRGKVKKKDLLTIKDKILLNKPADERTDHEKKYIYRIIGGLKCFKKYPNHVKKKLAARTYFKYYSPGRTIVRQHQEAHALYFIVTGDVTVNHLVFDDLLQEYVSVELLVLHSGDMFGEVSLLHNIPRTATCTTVGHCELLQLMQEDFKSVLQVSIQKQWDEVNNAMSAFTYFEALDDVSRRDGCIMAKMKSYEPNETILGDGVGVANFAYFILSGRCQMIESLQVIVTTHLGNNSYTLYDPYVPKEESEQDFDKKYFGAYKNVNASTVSRVESTKRTAKDLSEHKVNKSSEAKISKTSKSILKFSSEKQVRCESVQIVKENEERFNIAGPAQNRSSSMQSEIILPPTDSRHRESVRLSVTSKKIEEVNPHPSTIKTYFMQVCQFNPGSSFGFGENMRDRRIVALTAVNCMLLPMIWLLQRNTANIWTRIQHYLVKKIPTKKQLFKEFVTERGWQTFREQIVEDNIVAQSNTVNWTTVHDIPYSIRMEEMLDI